jgi:hypothetical protein
VTLWAFLQRHRVAWLVGSLLLLLLASSGSSAVAWCLR